MIPNHAQFIQAIQEKKKVWVKFYSKADSGVLEHTCAPLEYGPGHGVRDGVNRYWLWDDASNTGSHTVGLLPQEIVDLTVLGAVFDPAQCALVPSPLPDSKDQGSRSAPAVVAVDSPGGVTSVTS
jgi:hypothetical protein